VRRRRARVRYAPVALSERATPELSTLSLHDALPISSSNKSASPNTRPFPAAQAAPIATAMAFPMRQTTVRACLTQGRKMATATRSEEHTSELQSRENLVCRLLLEKKKHNPRGHAQRR